MNPEDARHANRRRRGLVLGAGGFVLVFAPAIAIAFSLVPSNLAVPIMMVGILLLVAGFITHPGSLANLLRPKP